MADLARGTYTGQFAFVYIEPKSNPGQYDQEIFLATHEWEPFYTTAEEEEEEPGPPPPKRKDETPNGWEIGYQRFTINGKCLGHGEPVRVKEGQRVLFHILNASATENIKLALPGHRFQVVALDGNPVPHPALVDVLELGTASAWTPWWKCGIRACGFWARPRTTTAPTAWVSSSNTPTRAARRVGSRRARRLGTTRCSAKTARFPTPTRPSRW
jgi:hypothetical protein